MLKPLARLLIASSLAGLAACMTLTGSGATKPLFCDIAKPIYWSAKDTDETIVQAKELNALGVKLCAWKS